MPDTDAFWMPFTSNRQFKAQPRLVASAEGVAFRTPTAARCSTASPACGAWVPGTATRASSRR